MRRLKVGDVIGIVIMLGIAAVLSWWLLSRGVDPVRIFVAPIVVVVVGVVAFFVILRRRNAPRAPDDDAESDDSQR